MSQMKGDWAKLARLQAQVRKLATGDTLVRLNNVLGATAIAEVQKGFRESRDPYGTPWKPLLLRRGKPLLDTGRLRSSFSYNASRRGFTIGTNFIGARVHQHGATITPKRSRFLRFRGMNVVRGRRRPTPWIFAKMVTIPARQMVPEGRLGDRWGNALNDAATEFLRKEIGK